MKLSWFNTSVGTHKLYLAYEYVQYKVMQDIREKELRDSGSTQIARYVSRFEPLLFVPASTQKDFQYVHTGPSTKGPPLRTLLLSQTQLSLHKRDMHKDKAKKRLQSNDHKQHLVITIDYK